MTGGSSRRLRIFAIMQIAASFLLLTGAAVLMRTLYTLEKTRPPFDTARVLAVNLPVMTYGRTPQQVQDFYHEVQRRVSALPGVTHVSTGFSVPWRDDQALNISFTFAAQGAARKNGLDDWRAKFRSVSPGYFETLGVPILQGRDFRDTDKNGSERVVIVSQSLAQTLFPGQQALNRELRWTDGVMKFIGISMEPRRIVGVVPDLDDENIIPSPTMMVYQPTDQEGWQGRLFVRAQQDPYALAPAITRTIHEISAEQPVERASTLAGHSRGGADAGQVECGCVRRIRGGGAADFRGGRGGCAGIFRERAHARVRHSHGARRAAAGHSERRAVAGPDDCRDWRGRRAWCSAFVFARGISRYVAEVHLPGMLAFVASAFVILAAAVIASAVPAARAARVNAVEALRSE